MESVRKSRGVFMSPDLDFAAAAKPRFCYVVASTERSGSNLLCARLWQTGFLGAPTEYFNFHTFMVQLIARFGVETMQDYVTRLFELRTSPNGVFATKAHWEQFEFMRTARVLERLPNPRFVFIDRADLLTQAVSYARALQTRQWHSLLDSRREPKYDFQLLLWCYSTLGRRKGNWRRAFSAMGITPVMVLYEDLAKDADAVIADVVRKLDFPAEPRASVTLPQIARQGDDISSDWAERFRKEAAARGHAV